MVLQSNLTYLSKKKNNQWGKHAVKLIECYEKKQPKKIHGILTDLNVLFQNNDLPEIPEKDFEKEFEHFIAQCLGKL